MNRMRVFAIGVAVLFTGAAVAGVVLRGRSAPEPGDDFDADLDRRPGCWVKVKSSEPGKCPGGVGRLHKGQCYMADWAECAKSY